MPGTRRRCGSSANTREPLGPLHGLPKAIKDTEPAIGFPFTRGSPIYRHDMPAADSVLVERLRKAGALLIGKTNVPEFGMGSHTYNNVYGTTLNPYDLTRSAGGSSGGAAAALAAGFIPTTRHHRQGISEEPLFTPFRHIGDSLGPTYGIKDS
jgi:amidase